MSFVKPSREQSAANACPPVRDHASRTDVMADDELLEALYPPRLHVVARPAPAALTYREVGQGYHPGGGLGLSILFHVLLLAMIGLTRSAFVYSARVVTEPSQQPTHSAVLLYLPVLGGGSEGGGHAGGGAGNASNPSSGLRARSRRGFAYRGPQSLVSSPPRATLGIQTILQPALKDLPLLKQLVPLPNVFRPQAAPTIEAARKALVVKPNTLAQRSTPDQPAVPPRIKLPLASSSAIPTLAESKPVIPERPTVKAITPRPAEVSDVPTAHREQQGLLVMNAIPPAPEMNYKIPHGEARALFAVAPAEATVIADPAAGAKTGEVSSAATGTGTRTDIAKGDALADVAAGGDTNNRVSGASGRGSGSRYGNGHGTGLNPSGNEAEVGRGTGTGSNVGVAAGSSHTSGTGAGTASGTGGFPGIAIQGGRYGSGSLGDSHPSTSPRHQTSYNMTIVSTASSGGGLPDLGVFNNEKIYTVYLDMKADDEDPSPNWILQYALLQPPSNPASASSSGSNRIQGTPTPPYAVLKDIPQFAPELLRKYSHQLLVAVAVMNTAGKLEQITLRQNSDPQLSSPLIEALGHWMFQPAQIDGKPVALKVLLGIRLVAGH